MKLKFKMINVKKRLILKKSNIHSVVLIFSLIFFSQTGLFFHDLVVIAQEEKELEVIVSPESPSQGDSVQIKIKKIEGKKASPKIFFDKTRYPAFELDENWNRTFIPLIANIKPGKHLLDIHYAGMVKNIYLDIKETSYKIETLTLGKETAGLMASAIERSSIGKALATASETKFWNGKFIYPCTGKHSTGYGVKRRINGVLSSDYFHKGLDFAEPKGAPVKAPEKGKIILAGYNSMGFNVNGNCVFLDHGHGIISAYLHLSEILVKENDIVEKGQLIGKVGSTGIATGPHLHWGIYVNGQPVEPFWWTSMVAE